MITVVISVDRVASFPDGGGHFWVYMQYVQALLRLGCNVYWLEQVNADRDPTRDAGVVANFCYRMKRFGHEGKALIYADGQTQNGAAGAIRFFGRAASEAEAVLRRTDLLLNF